MTFRHCHDFADVGISNRLRRMKKAPDAVTGVRGFNETGLSLKAELFQLAAFHELAGIASLSE